VVVGYERERRAVTLSLRAAVSVGSAPRQQRLNFLPEPQGHGALRGVREAACESAAGLAGAGAA